MSGVGGAADVAEGTVRLPISFHDLPYAATYKYVVQQRIDEHYPPAALLNDPRLERVRAEQSPAPAPAHTETGASVRTRSSGGRRPTADDVPFYDKEDAHNHLATSATEHLAAMPPLKESDAIVGFLYRCRAADSVLKIVQ